MPRPTLKKFARYDKKFGKNIDMAPINQMAVQNKNVPSLIIPSLNLNQTRDKGHKINKNKNSCTGKKAKFILMPILP